MKDDGRMYLVRINEAAMEHSGTSFSTMETLLGMCDLLWGNVTYISGGGPDDNSFDNIRTADPGKEREYIFVMYIDLARTSE